MKTEFIPHGRWFYLSLKLKQEHSWRKMSFAHQQHWCSPRKWLKFQNCDKHSDIVGPQLPFKYFVFLYAFMDSCHSFFPAIFQPVWFPSYYKTCEAFRRLEDLKITVTTYWSDFARLSFRAVPVCLSETPRFPFQHHLVYQRHHGGPVQFVLRVPLCPRLPAGQKELLPADLAGWWDTLLQVRK